MNRRHAVADALLALAEPKDPREWARKLKRRHEQGEALTLVQIEFYKDALRERDRTAQPVGDWT